MPKVLLTQWDYVANEVDSEGCHEYEEPWDKNQDAQYLSANYDYYITYLTGIYNHDLESIKQNSPVTFSVPSILIVECENRLRAIPLTEETTKNIDTLKACIKLLVGGRLSKYNILPITQKLKMFKSTMNGNSSHK